MQLYAEQINQQSLRKESYESEGSILTNNINQILGGEDQVNKQLYHESNGVENENIQSQIPSINLKANSESKHLKVQLKIFNSNLQRAQNSIDQKRSSSPHISPFEEYNYVENQFDKNEDLGSRYQKSQIKEINEDELKIQKHLQEDKHSVKLSQNKQNVLNNLGSKYSDIIRRKQTLQILSNHHDNKLILQYDKYLNTHIYDNKFILQRQKQIKQDQELYLSEKNNELSPMKDKFDQQLQTNMLLASIQKEDNNSPKKYDIQEKKSGFLSERLHYNETELMSIKKNDHIKERNKLRLMKFANNLNQSLLNGLSIYQNNLKGGYSNQRTKMRIARSQFPVDSKYTSRNSLNEEPKQIILEQILPSVQTQKMQNINDDFHRMNFTQKRAYYKQILFSQKNQTSSRLSNGQMNDEKNYVSQNQIIFKENLEKQKKLQESAQQINNKNISNQNNEADQNSSTQPFLDSIQSNKYQFKERLDEKQLISNNKQKKGKEDFEIKQFLRKDFVESRKKVILQKDIQEQVAKLTQLKRPEEYSKIYKILNIQEEKDSLKERNSYLNSNRYSSTTKNNRTNILSELSTPKKIGLLILTQAQQSNSKMNENENKNNFKQYKQQVHQKYQNQTNQVSPVSNIDKLINFGSENSIKPPSKFITKDEYLNDWVNGLKGLEIENNQDNNNNYDNNILEGEEDEESELNFFLKSQNFKQNQRYISNDKQRNARNSTSREIHKSQMNLTDRKSLQQDAQNNSSNKTVFKILSYQTNKKDSVNSNNKIKLEPQTQTNQVDQQTQIQSQTSEKAISASSFDNLDQDKQDLTHQQQEQNYSSKITSEKQQITLSEKGKRNDIKSEYQIGDLISNNQQNIIQQLQQTSKQSDQKKKFDKFKRNKSETQQQMSQHLPQILGGVSMQINQRQQIKKM